MRASVVVGVALAAMCGCASRPPGPTAVIRFVNPGHWSPVDVEAVRRGASVWVRLGFRSFVEYVPHLPECPRDWYRRGATECQITIGVVRDQELLTRDGVDGMADRDRHEIIVDGRWSGWNLTALLAHEVGHIILNTGRHLTPGAVGVMAAAGAEWQPTRADEALACETIGRGC